jgi:dTDP-4-amino-4,6-dideoxygalactose transaminase
VFADVLPDTFTLDPQAVEATIGPRTVAILPVHVFGHPCEVDELEQLAKRHHLALVFDAAHALGSCYKNQPVGRFGEAEVFSFHATKILPVGEGGCITTGRDDLAAYLRLARNFGDSGDGNTLFPGVNAKLQEFNAILGLAGLRTLDQHIASRRRQADYLVHRLSVVPGLSFPSTRPHAFINYQNLAILVAENDFGMSRDHLAAALAVENIMARKYFYPPLHRHQAYREFRALSLPVTERISNQILCLPFYSEMEEATVEGICLAIERIHAHAPAVRRVLAGTQV